MCTDNKLQDLFRYIQIEGRICPKPGEWHELWEMLPDKKRVGSGWNPPLPLILAAWDHTTGLEKILRLRQHIEYAAEHDALEAVEKYLRNLSPDKWHVIGNK